MWLEHLAHYIISWIAAGKPLHIDIVGGMVTYYLLCFCCFIPILLCPAGDTTGLALHVVSSSRTFAVNFPFPALRS